MKIRFCSILTIDQDIHDTNESWGEMVDEMQSHINIMEAYTLDVQGRDWRSNHDNKLLEAMETYLG